MTPLGVVLPTRSAALGHVSVEELMSLASMAEEAGWNSVWVGDSLFAKPRLDAIAVLGALAVRTARVRLGAACMATAPLRHPLVLAAQWASLDCLSNGRMTFVACPGQPARGGEFQKEYDLLGVDPRSRWSRMLECARILKVLSSTDGPASFHGTHYSFDDVRLVPRPVQRPLPVFFATSPDSNNVERANTALRRVAEYGDGWMVTGKYPSEIAALLEMLDEQPTASPRSLRPRIVVYHNINVQSSRSAAYQATQSYLRTYYKEEFTEDFVVRRVAMGPPESCAEQLQALFDCGADEVILRVTDTKPRTQMRLVLEQVAPLLKISS